MWQKYKIQPKSSMKNDRIIYCVIGLLVGALVTSMVVLSCKWQWDYTINIIDFSTLLATIGLSVAVVFLTKSLDKKDVVRDMLVQDLKELCDVYSANSDIIKKLSSGDISIDTARDEIKMVFHKGDLVIDCIREELKESFPKFKKENDVNLIELTTTYYKWLTDGDLMKNDFQITLDYQKEHETILRNTIKPIKLVIHKLVKVV